eukprot:COSAG01_NODE_765_length_13738_cov_21.521870_9_plen_233_part_00
MAFISNMYDDSTLVGGGCVLAPGFGRGSPQGGPECPEPPYILLESAEGRRQLADDHAAARTDTIATDHSGVGAIGVGARSGKSAEESLALNESAAGRSQLADDHAAARTDTTATNHAELTREGFVTRCVEAGMVTRQEDVDLSYAQLRRLLRACTTDIPYYCITGDKHKVARLAKHPVSQRTKTFTHSFRNPTARMRLFLTEAAEAMPVSNDWDAVQEWHNHWQSQKAICYV